MDAAAAVELARELVTIDTAGAGESAVVAVLEPILAAAGADVARVALGAGRDNLVATVGSAPLALTGHLDTVPYDHARWSFSPTAGEVVGGRLLGRGSCDMKGGVAAMVAAVVAHLERDHRCAGVRLLLTAGEETGCRGAQILAERGAGGSGELLVVGEPTANLPRFGHKGATWLDVSAAGRAAHGSRPDLGHNAVLDLASAALRLLERFPAVEHAELGRASVNLGALHGGSQHNLVPDAASMLVDIRTVPGLELTDVEAALTDDPEAVLTLCRSLHLPPVWTDPALAPARRALDALDALDHKRSGSAGGRALDGAAAAGSGPWPAAGERAMSYFSDASVLAPGGYGAVLLLGPGDPDQAHTVDEWCSLGQIETAFAQYGALLDAWCEAPSRI